MERLIFHVDVNSAFLSWESARRVKNGETDLRGVPAVISGDNTLRTSVVLAKSMSTKKFGVRTGEPISMALRKCPTLQVVAPDFKLYEACSEAFIEICRSYAPVLQQFSIDECFMDMSQTEHMYPDPIATANEIKDKIRNTLGFTVNIGIGSNKLLAKTASDFEKPDKVHTLFTREIPQKLWPLPVGELLFVGRSTVEKLEKLGIHTIGELAAMDVETLRRYMGMKMGQQLHEYSNGIDLSPVLAVQRQAKGYSAETTFEQNLSSLQEARRTLLDLCDGVCRRLRAGDAMALCVSVHIRYSDFADRSHQRRLSEPTDVTGEVFQMCSQLLDELWDGKAPLRLMGVALSDVTRQCTPQLSLFPDEKREREKKKDQVMDALRARYGADTITRASVKDLPHRSGLKHRLQKDKGSEEL